MENDNSSPVIPLTSPEQIVPLMTSFAEDGVRSVDIFSHHLNPTLYDAPDLVAAVSAIARRSRQSRVRIMVREPAPLYGSDRPLLSLVQRLPSRAEIKVYSEGAKDRYFGFFCIDKKHLLYFSDESHAQGFARRDARAESRHTLNEFEHLWLYGSASDPNLRILTL